jgi:cell division protein FtsW (lipid II flippase)
MAVNFAAVRRFDWTLAAAATVLCCLGALAIARADTFASGTGSFPFRQVLWLVISCCALAASLRVNYRGLSRSAFALMVLSLLLLVAVYFFPATNGARRWLRVGTLSFQPSEFAKLAYVLALAKYLMYRNSYRRVSGLLLPLGLTLLPVLIILKEPDLGTALLFFPVLLAMLFAAGARLRHLSIVALAGICLSPLLWSQMSREQRSRITALAEQTTADQRPTDDGYHLHQAKQMLALGGVGGSWLRDLPDHEPYICRVPEAHTDAIFTVVVERFGLWGAGLMLVLYSIVVWRCLVIAQSTREPFGRLISTGVGTLLAVQVLINTGMMVGLLPITGLALPLISYGGSSMLATLLGLGLVLNVGLHPGYEVAGDPFRFSD